MTLKSGNCVGAKSTVLHFMLLVAFLYGTVVHCDNEDSANYGTLVLEAGQSQQFAIPPNNITQLLLWNISSDASYVVTQVQTQYRNVTLSMYRDISEDTSVTGNSIGVDTLLQRDQSHVILYLLSEQNVSVTAIITATVLTKKDPLPGGCNMEFNLENDPNFHLHYNSFTIYLDFEWANIGFARDVMPLSCESKTDQARLRYDIYAYYIGEEDLTELSFLKAIEKMSDPDFIVKHAVKVGSIVNTEATRSDINLPSYPSQGIIYNAVVFQSDAKGKAVTSKSAYVPISTYACSFHNESRNNCYKLHSYSVVGLILVTLGALVGLFICYFGHRFFKTEMAIFGFLSFTLIFFLIFTQTSLSHDGSVLLACFMGIIGGVLWLLLWWFAGMPILSMILPGFISGYLIASLLFFTPFGNMKYWETPLNYGITFTCALFMIPLILLAFTKVLNIFTCTFVGAYGVVVCMDAYLRSSLKYVVLDSIKHAVIPNFDKTVATIPFETSDIILSVLWAFLFITGMVFQFYRERGRAPFPPCPWSVRKLRRAHQISIQHAGNDERKPLLQNTSPRQPISEHSEQDMQSPVGDQEERTSVQAIQ